MKKLIILLSFFMTVVCNAQDVITMKNGEIIKAKVLEITDTDIKFKKAANINGPTYIYEKTDVVAILYENGVAENFVKNETQKNSVTTKTPTKESTTKTTTPKLKTSKSLFEKDPVDAEVEKANRIAAQAKRDAEKAKKAEISAKKKAEEELYRKAKLEEREAVKAEKEARKKQYEGVDFSHFTLDLMAGVQIAFPRFTDMYSGSKGGGFSISPRYEFNNIFAASLGFNMYRDELSISNSQVISGFHDPDDVNPNNEQYIRFQSLQGDLSLYYNPVGHKKEIRNLKTYLYVGGGFAINHSAFDSNKKEKYSLVKFGLRPMYYIKGMLGLFVDANLLLTSEKYIGCYVEPAVLVTTYSAGVSFRF